MISITSSKGCLSYNSRIVSFTAFDVRHSPLLYVLSYMYPVVWVIEFLFLYLFFIFLTFAVYLAREAKNAALYGRIPSGMTNIYEFRVRCAGWERNIFLYRQVASIGHPLDVIQVRFTIQEIWEMLVNKCVGPYINIITTTRIHTFV